MLEYDFIEDDTGSKLRVPCVVKGTTTPVNLSACTVTLSWYDRLAKYQSRTMAHVDDVGGIAEYLFVAGELFAPTMVFQVVVVDSGGKILHSVNRLVATVGKKFVANP